MLDCFLQLRMLLLLCAVASADCFLFSEGVRAGMNEPPRCVAVCQGMAPRPKRGRHLRTQGRRKLILRKRRGEMFSDRKRESSTAAQSSRPQTAGCRYEAPRWGTG